MRSIISSISLSKISISVSVSLKDLIYLAIFWNLSMYFLKSLKAPSIPSISSGELFMTYLCLYAHPKTLEASILNISFFSNLFANLKALFSPESNSSIVLKETTKRETINTPQKAMIIPINLPRVVFGKKSP